MRTDWTKHTCPDCGLRLDHFGACLLAEARDVERGTAPVRCGLSPAFARAFLACLLQAYVQADSGNDTGLTN